MSADRIYLSKDGKSFGPYTAAQIDEFQKNGQITQYAWMCTDPKVGWVPIAPPPPPPPPPGDMNTESDLNDVNEPVAPTGASASPSAAAEPVASAAAQQPVPTPVSESPKVPSRPVPNRPPEAAAPTLPHAISDTSSILALCHDFKKVLSGSLIEINATGATLSKTKPHEPMPSFRKGAKVLLNLLDDTSGRSENVRTVVSGAVKKDGHWEYRLRWDGLPEILKRP